MHILCVNVWISGIVAQPCEPKAGGVFGSVMPFFESIIPLKRMIDSEDDRI